MDHLPLLSRAIPKPLRYGNQRIVNKMNEAGWVVVDDVARLEEVRDIVVWLDCVGVLRERVL